MRNYRAFYKGKTFDLQAPNVFMAQEAAAKALKVKKSWQVAVVPLDQPLDTSSL